MPPGEIKKKYRERENPWKIPVWKKLVNKKQL
jgi:hypothetical protein